jgi:hypothetical protein
MKLSKSYANVGTSYMSDIRQKSIAVQRLVDLISTVTHKRNNRNNTGAVTTVALRVVRGDKRELSAYGNNCATLFLGDINTGKWHSKLGESHVRQ